MYRSRAALFFLKSGLHPVRGGFKSLNRACVGCEMEFKSLNQAWDFNGQDPVFDFCGNLILLHVFR